MKWWNKRYWNNGPLKYLSNFWRPLGLLLINCEINLTLTWSENCFIIANAVDCEVPTFEITDTKLYIPVVTLSISNVNDNKKQLQ